MVRVRATDKFIRTNTKDGEVNKFRYYGEEWEVNEARAEMLVSKGFCVYVKDEPHEVVEVEPLPKEEAKETKKRGRKKKS